MHQCLCIEDILRVAFDYVDEHEYDPTQWIYVRREHALKTLAALTRTCRTFKDPALDVLWREIPDLYVLIKSLAPSRLLKVEKSILYFVSQPTVEDWKPFDPFIDRVQVMGTPLPFTKPKCVLLHRRSILQPLTQYLRDYGPSTKALLPRGPPCYLVSPRSFGMNAGSGSTISSETCS
ncbi:hypothetical protein V8D89_009536 [Ganoderma adspersum]